MAKHRKGHPWRNRSDFRRGSTGWGNAFVNGDEAPAARNPDGEAKWPLSPSPGATPLLAATATAQNSSDTLTS